MMENIQFLPMVLVSTLSDLLAYQLLRNVFGEATRAIGRDDIEALSTIEIDILEFAGQRGARNGKEIILCGDYPETFVERLRTQNQRLHWLRTTEILRLDEVVEEWMNSQKKHPETEGDIDDLRKLVVDANTSPYAHENHTAAKIDELLKARATQHGFERRVRDLKSLYLDNPKINEDDRANADMFVKRGVQALANARETGRVRTFLTGRKPEATTPGPATILAVLPSSLAPIADLLMARELLENWPHPAACALALLERPKNKENNSSSSNHSDLTNDVATATLESVIIDGAGISVIYLETLRNLFPGLDTSEPGRKKSGVYSCTKSKDKTLLDRLVDHVLNDFLIGNRPVAFWRTHFYSAFLDRERRVERSFLRRINGKGYSGAVKSVSPAALPESSSPQADYFLPELQPGLFGGHTDTETRSIRSFELEPGTNGLHIILEHGNYPSSFKRDIAKLRVHFDGQGTMLLEWIVEGASEEMLRSSIKKINKPDAENGKPLPEWPPLEGSHGCLWRNYLLNRATQETIAEVLDFNAEARLVQILYPRQTVDTRQQRNPTELSLHQQNTGANARICSASDLSSRKSDDLEKAQCGFLQLLLQVILEDDTVTLGRHPDSGAGLLQVSDDRARLSSSIILEGATALTPRLMPHGADGACVIRSLLNMVDPYDTGFNYSSDRSRVELAESTYDRFADFGSHFMTTDHSFTFLGHRHHPGAHHGEKWGAWHKSGGSLPQPGFAERFIHPEHMAFTYQTIFRHFLFMEAELRALAIEHSKIEASIPTTPRDLTDPEMTAIRNLRHGLVLASNALRQITLSSQLQGKELTQHFHDRFKLEEQWEALDRKTAALEQLLENHEQRKNETLKDIFYFAGLPLLIWAYLFDKLTSDVKPDPAKALLLPIQKPLEGLFEALQLGAWAMPLSIFWISLVFILVIWLTFRRYLDWREGQSFKHIRNIRNWKKPAWLLTVLLVMWLLALFVDNFVSASA